MRLLARTIPGAIAGLLCLLAGGCGGDPLDQLAEGERGRVEVVFFGGRLRLSDGREVRLAGVDVPGRGEPGGAQARAVLERAAGGREVALLYGGPRRDGFGREVAHVRILGRRRWLQGALLREGAARVRTSAADRALAREMLALEARARAAGRGTWGDPEWRVRLPREVGAPGFAVVEGRLGRVHPTFAGAGAALGSGELTLEVRRRALSEMAAAGRPFEAFAGGLVRVRGVIRRSRTGWALEIDHPEQIEPLADR